MATKAKKKPKERPLRSDSRVDPNYRMIHLRVRRDLLGILAGWAVSTNRSQARMVMEMIQHFNDCPTNSNLKWLSGPRP